MSAYIKLLILPCFLQSTFAYACRCDGPRTFCEAVQTSPSYGNSDEILIVRGVFTKNIHIKDEEWGLSFKIKESFHNPRALSKITVREGGGSDCFLTLFGYHIGQELIIHVWLQDLGVKQFVMFSDCEPPPLVVKDNNVTGQIKEGIHKMSLWQFRQSYCRLNPLVVKHIIKTHLVRNQLRIAISETGHYGITIFDSLGRIVKKLPSHLRRTDDQILISTDYWTTGLYFLNIQSRSTNTTRAILVNQ